MRRGDKVSGERLRHVLIDLAVVYAEDVTLWSEHELSESVQTHHVLCVSKEDFMGSLLQ